MHILYSNNLPERTPSNVVLAQVFDASCLLYKLVDLSRYIQTMEPFDIISGKLERYEFQHRSAS